MRILVDTHAFFWWLTDYPRLSKVARDALEEPGAELLISAVVAWELATKGRIGKWPGALAAADGLEDFVAAEKLRPLPISLAHAKHAGLLRARHRDPFDRMLAAQAELEAVPLVTSDRVFETFGVQIVW